MLSTRFCLIRPKELWDLQIFEWFILTYCGFPRRSIAFVKCSLPQSIRTCVRLFGYNITIYLVMEINCYSFVFFCFSLDQSQLNGFVFPLSVVWFWFRLITRPTNWLKLFFIAHEPFHIFSCCFSQQTWYILLSFATKITVNGPFLLAVQCLR